MILDELYNVISDCLKETTAIDELIKRINEREIVSNIVITETDQEIDDYLKVKENEEDARKIFFAVIQKIKIENSIEKISDEIGNEEIQKNKDRIKALFGNILEPDYIEINDKQVSINYSINSNSRLDNKLKEVEKWEEDNVKETIAEKLGIPNLCACCFSSLTIRNDLCPGEKLLLSISVARIIHDYLLKMWEILAERIEFPECLSLRDYLMI